MTDYDIADHFKLELAAVRRLIKLWSARLPESAVYDAIAKAIRYDAKSWKYVERILQSQVPTQSQMESAPPDAESDGWTAYPDGRPNIRIPAADLQRYIEQQRSQSAQTEDEQGGTPWRGEGDTHRIESSDDCWVDVLATLRVMMSNGGDYRAFIADSMGRRVAPDHVVMQVRNGFVYQWIKQRCWGRSKARRRGRVRRRAMHASHAGWQQQAPAGLSTCAWHDPTRGCASCPCAPSAISFPPNAACRPLSRHLSRSEPPRSRTLCRASLHGFAPRHGSEPLSWTSTCFSPCPPGRIPPARRFGRRRFAFACAQRPLSDPGTT